MKYSILCIVALVSLVSGAHADDQLLQQALKTNNLLANKLEVKAFKLYSTATQAKLDGKLGIGGTAVKATSLAANGANCGAGQAAQGVDASGIAEGCFTPPGTYVLPITDSTSTTDSTMAASATAVKSAYNLANGKEPTITAGTSSQYWRGDKTWQGLGIATAWTPVLNSFTTSGVVILTGQYVRIGALVVFSCKIDGVTNGATITSTSGSSYISGLPVATGAYFAVANAIDSSAVSLGNGAIGSTSVNTPTFTRTGANIYVSGSYLTY